MTEQFVELINHTVYVWPPLAPAWKAGAYLTSLFDWKAIAAVGTFTAVWIALRRDRRSEQVALMKERGMVIALAKTCGSALIVIKAMPNAFPHVASSESKTDPAKAKMEVVAVKRLQLMNMTLDVLNSCKMNDFSTSKAMRSWANARTAFRQIEVDLDHIEEGGTTKTSSTLKLIEGALEYWADYEKNLRARAHPFRARWERFRDITVED